MDKNFQGLWAETTWIYEFKSDGHFKLKAEGHYDFAEYSGTYIINDGIVFLNPDSDWQLLDGTLKPRLKIINSECLRDFDDNFYCSSIESTNKMIEREWEFKSKMISLLDTLSITKQEKEKTELTKGESTLGDFVVSFKYDGIIVDKKRELHAFILDKSDYLNSWTIERYLINKAPFEIYQHTTRRDSLVLIYKD